LKSPSVQIIDRIVQVRYSARIDGQVTQRNACHLVAPSTAADSYRSLGIARRPAIRINVQNGSDFQMWVRIASDNASIGSLSQLGPSSPVKRKISELTKPHSGLSMNRIDRMVGIEGSAQGRTKRAASQRIQTRCCTKKSDRNSATTILRLMPTIRNTRVLTTERAKMGSSNKVT
jgi:hypothetical protein